MNILFITDNFPPEVNAPASRTYEHCREWVKAGHKVTIITCNPNFPQGVLYSGYDNKLVTLETIDGIRVIRVWSFITANTGFVKRILDYMSFMLASTLASLKLGNFDLVIGTSPQFFTVVSAFMISKIKNIPFVFELRDIWPESIRAVGAMKSSRVLNMFESLELFLYRKARKIISLTKAFKANLIQRLIEGEKIHVVRNGVDLTRFYPREKNKQLLTKLGLSSEHFILGYIGTHGMAHDLNTILRAAQHIQRSEEEFTQKAHFLLIGDGAAKKGLLQEAKAMGLENISFLDPVTKDEIADYWALLDVSIIHLKKTPLFKTVIPSKIFESMAMGVPIFLGVEGESAEIVKEGAGFCFDPGNEKALTDLIRESQQDNLNLSETKELALVLARNYDRRNLASKMLNMLSKSF